ncbi:unnamed protein product [Sphagnum balticum]
MSEKELGHQVVDEDHKTQIHEEFTPSDKKETYTLKATEDMFDGIIVDPTGLPKDIPTFVKSLKISLEFWKSQNKKGVWLKLPIANSNLVQPALQEGLKYHHAESTYVMLVTWLSSSPSTIPRNASHQVGIGAFVVNDKHEILAVQAKNGALRETEIWEVPTGLLNQGEDLSAGAVRKVKEETGIETDFIKVIGFRHTHKVVYEKSDLLFLCLLHPLTSTIAKQELEHANVQWIPLSQFSAQDYLQDQKMLKKMIDVCISTLEGNHNGFSPRNMQTGRKRGSRYFYYNTDDCKD